MNVRHIIHNSLLVLASTVALVSCDEMKEDLSDCPTGLYVNFVYDYNIQRADMFKDHVGSVTLYVYDESDALVVQRTVSGVELSQYGYNMHFSEQELAPGHQYRLQALALQRDWTAQLQTAGAKYRRSELAAGASRRQLSVTLDHAASAASPYYEVPSVAPLDTLWHTLTVLDATSATQPAATRHHELADGTVTDNGIGLVSVVSGEPTYATVSLIRDTKHLNISLRELEADNTFGDVSADDYEVFILDQNATVDCDNRVVTPGDSLVYRPYAEWTTVFDAQGQLATAQRSAHFDLMFNRLMYSPVTDENAVLCIRRRATAEREAQTVAVINLAEVLCEGRLAFEIQQYSPQEYLDREYDYRLEFYLKGDHWQYISVCVDVLSWAKRIQYVEF